jgi:hypothetical protein
MVERTMFELLPNELLLQHLLIVLQHWDPIDLSHYPNLQVLKLE